MACLLQLVKRLCSNSALHNETKQYTQGYGKAGSVYINYCSSFHTLTKKFLIQVTNFIYFNICINLCFTTNCCIIFKRNACSSVSTIRCHFKRIVYNLIRQDTNLLSLIHFTLLWSMSSLDLSKPEGRGTHVIAAKMSAPSLKLNFWMRVF